MQYILSQEEYTELLTKINQAQSINSHIRLTKKQLGQLCMKIADTMPVKWEGWNKDHPVEPWGCWHSLKKENQEWYCDNCPVQKICPLDQTYSQ